MLNGLNILEVMSMIDIMRKGFLIKGKSGVDCDLIRYFNGFVSTEHLKSYLEQVKVTHYLIINPHPLADMIYQQARTGQPVWIRLPPHVCSAFVQFIGGDWKVVKVGLRTVTVLTTKPCWYLPGAQECRFTPFDEAG